MILDQQNGAHAAQVEYIGLGWGYSWVSGEGETPLLATLVDRWADVLSLSIDATDQLHLRIEEPR